MFNFLHLEVTSRCQKNCWFCGRRKIEKDYPHLAKWGDMPLDMVKLISEQVPRGTVVQFHNNGEPLLYPDLEDALMLFPHCIRQFDTNAKLLLDHAGLICRLLDILTISVIPAEPSGEDERWIGTTSNYQTISWLADRHPDSDDQYDTVKTFLDLKGSGGPLMVYRLLGDIDQGLKQQYATLPGLVAIRVLHNPMGSFGYEKPVTIPEIGMCQEILTHLAIDRFGDVSPCVRFDPERTAVFGNVRDVSLENIWHGKNRGTYIKAHMRGRRSELPLCSECEYWGIAVGG